MRRADSGTRLEHYRNGAGGIERAFVRQKIAQGLSFKQLHHDVQITIFGRTKIGDRNCVWVLHAAGGARLASEALLCGLIADKSLAQDFQRHRSIDEQVGGPINCAHTAAAQKLIQAVFPFEYPTQKRIAWQIGNGCVSLQR